MFFDLLRYFYSQCHYCLYIHLNRLAFSCTTKSLNNLSGRQNGKFLLCLISTQVNIHSPMPFRLLFKIFKHIFFLASEVDYPSQFLSVNNYLPNLLYVNRNKKISENCIARAQLPTNSSHMTQEDLLVISLIVERPCPCVSILGGHDM